MILDAVMDSWDWLLNSHVTKRARSLSGKYIIRFIFSRMIFFILSLWICSFIIFVNIFIRKNKACSVLLFETIFNNNQQIKLYCSQVSFEDISGFPNRKFRYYIYIEWDRRMVNVIDVILKAGKLGSIDIS